MDYLAGLRCVFTFDLISKQLKTEAGKPHVARSHLGMKFRKIFFVLMKAVSYKRALLILIEKITKKKTPNRRNCNFYLDFFNDQC